MMHVFLGILFVMDCLWAVLWGWHGSRVWCEWVGGRGVYRARCNRRTRWAINVMLLFLWCVSCIDFKGLFLQFQCSAWLRSLCAAAPATKQHIQTLNPDWGALFHFLFGFVFYPTQPGGVGSVASRLLTDFPPHKHQPSTSVGYLAKPDFVEHGAETQQEETVSLWTVLSSVLVCFSKFNSTSVHKVCDVFDVNQKQRKKTLKLLTLITTEAKTQICLHTFNATELRRLIL